MYVYVISIEFSCAGSNTFVIYDVAPWSVLTPFDFIHCHQVLKLINP